MGVILTALTIPMALYPAYENIIQKKVLMIYTTLSSSAFTWFPLVYDIIFIGNHRYDHMIILYVYKHIYLFDYLFINIDF